MNNKRSSTDYLGSAVTGTEQIIAPHFKNIINQLWLILRKENIYREKKKEIKEEATKLTGTLLTNFPSK